MKYWGLEIAVNTVVVPLLLQIWPCLCHAASGERVTYSLSPNVAWHNILFSNEWGGHELWETEFSRWFPTPFTSLPFCRSGYEVKVFSVVINQTDQDNKTEEVEKTNEETAPAGEAEGAAEKATEEAKTETEEEKVGEEEKPAGKVEGEEKPAEGGAEEAAGESEQAGETAADEKTEEQQETEGAFSKSWYLQGR